MLLSKVVFSVRFCFYFFLFTFFIFSEFLLSTISVVLWFMNVSDIFCGSFYFISISVSACFALLTILSLKHPQARTHARTFAHQQTELFIFAKKKRNWKCLLVFLASGCSYPFLAFLVSLRRWTPCTVCEAIVVAVFVGVLDKRLRQQSCQKSK